MAVLSEEAKRIITTVQLAFVATASKDGRPNVSPKGSFRVLDDEHVAFAEISSPRTISNLKENQQLSAVIFDPAAFGGCRVWGRAEILESGDLVEVFKAQFASQKMKVNYVVKVAIEKVEIIPSMRAR